MTNIVQLPGSLQTEQSPQDYIFNLGAKLESIKTPFWPKLDGQLALMDIPTAELISLQKTTLDRSGKLDEGLFIASIICRCLVFAETRQPVFDVKAASSVSGLGSTILLPLAKAVKDFLGLDDLAVEQAKKN